EDKGTPQAPRGVPRAALLLGRLARAGAPQGDRDARGPRAVEEGRQWLCRVPLEVEGRVARADGPGHPGPHAGVARGPRGGAEDLRAVHRDVPVARAGEPGALRAGE